jgi:DNA-binding Lrp family transcriptional regulator
VDALDIRILRAMGPVPYVLRPNGGDALRPARISRSVGVSPETVRDRIARMEKAGVIEGYELVPNLRLFGLEAGAFLFLPPDEEHRNAMRRTLGVLDGLLEVTYFLGTETCVDLCYRAPGERDRRLRALAEASGDPEPKPFFGWSMPPAPRALTPLDWRILRALRGRADRSLAVVAAELGVSYRTVKRHYDRMAAEGSFFVKPVLNPAREAGLVPFVLLFFFRRDAEPATVHRILREFEHEFIFGSAPASPRCGNFDLLVFAGSPAEVERLRERAAAVPGVARVQALVLAGIEPRMEWLDDFLEARVREAAGPRVARGGEPAPTG